LKNALSRSASKKFLKFFTTSLGQEAFFSITRVPNTTPKKGQKNLVLPILFDHFFVWKFFYNFHSQHGFEPDLGHFFLYNAHAQGHFTPFKVGATLCAFCLILSDEKWAKSHVVYRAVSNFSYPTPVVRFYYKVWQFFSCPAFL